ncbi:MAG: prepilin peptidase, partial [Minisyncoccia bacterium]
PILSFIFLKGKCRYCKEKISLQYPLVEFFTGFLFFLTYFKFSFYDFKNFFYFLSLLIIHSCLILIFVFDLKYYLIPDSFLVIGILFSFLYNLPFFLKNFSYFELFLSFLPAILFFFLWLISKGNWIGFGDVKMAIFMAIFLFWPKVLLAVFLSSLLGAFLGVILIFFGKKTLKSQIPFGPFLVLGTLTTFFFGENIINWYLSKFIF